MTNNTCKCAGLCMCNLTKDSIQQVNIDKQERAQEDGFTNRQINQIVSSVSHVFENSKLHRDLWVEGFMRGFEEGKNYGD